MLITFKINGEPAKLDIDPQLTLQEVLHDRCNLLSVREGCGSGECGACSVILNGKVVPSCLILAVDADQGDILTVEGLRTNGGLHPVQEAFVKHGAIQCGFCSPGFILSAKSLLENNPRPSEEEIRSALEGNLCRCTGYIKIFEAIKSLCKS